MTNKTTPARKTQTNGGDGREAYWWAMPTLPWNGSYKMVRQSYHYLLLLIFFLLFPLSAEAATVLTEQTIAVNTVWTVANSPYQLTGDITLAKDFLWNK